jgi:antitoxin CptB
MRGFVPRMTDHLENTGLDPRRRKLLYQARHRGTKEADKVIGGYVERHVAAMTMAQLDELDVILACPDPDLLSWLLGFVPTPPDWDRGVFRAMRESL